MDIISLPVEIEKTKLDSRYRLVIVAAQRARQLMEGADPTIGHSTSKETSVAIEEVLGNSLEILYGEEALVAQKEEKRLREEKKRQAFLAEREMEVTSHVKKDLNIYLEGALKKEIVPNESSGESSEE